MGYDIHGNVLKQEHCERHPNINEPYPCWLCNEEEREMNQYYEDREIERYYNEEMARQQSEAYYEMLNNEFVNQPKDCRP
jgi:hypothetical protein